MHDAVREHGPFCDACFGGRYAAPLVDLERKLPVSSHC
jgi:hypothetical protein